MKIITYLLDFSNNFCTQQSTCKSSILQVHLHQRHKSSITKSMTIECKQNIMFIFLKCKFLVRLYFSATWKRCNNLGGNVQFNGKYRSALLRTVEIFTLAPIYLSGHRLEKQSVYVEFFDDFTDDPLRPAIRADFQLQSRFAEVYDARLLPYYRVDVLV